MGTFADDRLHIDSTIIRQFQDGRERFALFGYETVQQDAAVLQQFDNLTVIHLPVADNPVDVEYAGRLFPDVVFTTVTLAGLYYVAATQWATSYDFLFCFHLFTV